eukprot:15472396-Alexandrium_andersonii.AAC.1
MFRSLWSSAMAPLFCARDTQQALSLLYGRPAQPDQMSYPLVCCATARPNWLFLSASSPEPLCERVAGRA